MVEKEAEIKFNPYDEALKHYKERKEKVQKEAKIIKGKEIPWMVTKQGVLRHLHTDTMSGHSLETVRMFVHEIRTHSSRHIHQGGFNLFVLEGKGCTVVDGVRFDWSEGDLILLPSKKGGVEHQHFNIDNKPSRLLVFSSIEIELSSPHPHFETTNRVSLIEEFYKKIVPEEMLEYDIVVRMPPKKRCLIELDVNRIRKAEPKVVEPEWI